MSVSAMLKGYKSIARDRNIRFTDAVITRIMPVWDYIGKEIEEYQDELWDSMMNSPGTGEEDPGDYVDWIIDQAIDHYDDLSFMKEATLNTMSVGLYHLWEKDIKHYLIVQLSSLKIRKPRSKIWRLLPSRFRPSTIQFYSTDDSTIRKTTIERANFDVLKKIFRDNGFVFTEQTFYSEIRVLNWVINASKHSKAPPAKLASERPDLISESQELRVTIEAFNGFSDALAQFWAVIDIIH